MAQIDENQEVIARIRMTIDNHDKARRFPDAEDDEIPDQDEQDKLDAEQCHWSLGAPERITTAKVLEQGIFRHQRNRFFRQFDSRLKSFLREHISANCIGTDEPLKVSLDQFKFFSVVDLQKGTRIQMSLPSISILGRLDCGSGYCTMQS